MPRGQAIRISSTKTWWCGNQQVNLQYDIDEHSQQAGVSVRHNLFLGKAQGAGELARPMGKCFFSPTITNQLSGAVLIEEPATFFCIDDDDIATLALQRCQRHNVFVNTNVSRSVALPLFNESLFIPPAEQLIATNFSEKDDVGGDQFFQ